MASREPIEDQNHEAGDETYTTNRFIDSNDNDQQQDDSNEEHQASLGKRLKAEPELQRMERNGQAPKDAGATIGSNDTATPSKSFTSDSVNSSPVRTPTSHQEQQSSDMHDVTSPQSATQESASAPGTSKNDQGKAPTHRDDDEELEEGELKDDDDDSDDDIPADNNVSNNNNRFSTLSNDGNDNINNGSLSKDSPFGDQRMHNQHQQSNSSSFSGRGGGHGPANQFRNQHHRRHMSPNQQPQHLPPGMHLPYPPNQHFGGMNDDYRFPPNHEGSMTSPMGGMPPHMAHPMAGPAGPYPRGGPPGPGGPMPKANVRCRFYSRTSNKCTWGDHCRFEHRDDSPGPNDVFDDRMPGPGMGPMPMRGPPPPPPHMGPERPYPPYPTRHQPYPAPPQPYGYSAYEQPPFGPQHSASPPLPHHAMPPHHWRQQHSPYPSPSSSNHPPESVSPSLNPAGPGPQPVSVAKPPNGGPSVPPAPSSSASPGYSSPSSSAVYERKHRLAYELAPWNDRGYPPPSKYDRDPAGGYPPAGPRGGYYRNHYSRDPYGREPPPPHMNGPPYPYSSSGLPPSYPSAYKGSPMGPYPPSHRYSSQRGMPPDLGRSRSTKRGHDEDESSWSDSGSEDSILGQSSSGNKNSASKSKKHQRATHDELDESSPKEQADQGGSGTPPGEPLPEDRERQEMLLNKLKEIEDLMAKKKGEQEDPM